MNKANLDRVVKKLQDDALELADQVERLYQGRCSPEILDRCARGNFHECVSELPTQQCLSGSDVVLEACGDGQTCSSLWDLQASTFRVPLGLVDDASEILLNREDVIESVCFSQGLDDYWNQKREEDQGFWADLNVRHPQAFFGSSSGAFRIYPGRMYSTCGTYDPRVRPWYISASSGPKNVVLVLDTSGSMERLRLDYLKEAAKRVIETLTFSDRVAIVQFATEANIFALGGKYVYKATADNKKLLMDAVDNFEANGATNMLEAFEKTFQILNDSIDDEKIVTCGGGVPGNTAILFLTDGEVTRPEELMLEERQNEVERVVVEGLANLETRTRRAPFLFTYSISENAIVHEFPKKMACAARGLWSKINEPSEIVDSLSSYYEVFTFGLGSGANEQFTAWADPYIFATGGLLGTTVSAPVYDRTTSPPLFLGAVGIDMFISALDMALGVSPDDPDASEAQALSLEEIVQASTAFCPELDLTLCELESIRRRGVAGDEALCTSNCSSADFVDIEARTCATIHDYPSDLIENRRNAGLSYEQRTCCKVDDPINRPSDECPLKLVNGTRGGGFPVGIFVAALTAVILLLVVGLYVYRRCRTSWQNESSGTSQTSEKLDNADTERGPDSQDAPGPFFPTSRESSAMTSPGSVVDGNTPNSPRATPNSNGTEHNSAANEPPDGAPTVPPLGVSVRGSSDDHVLPHTPFARLVGTGSDDSLPPDGVVVTAQALPDNIDYKDLGRNLSSVFKNGGSGP